MFVLLFNYCIIKDIYASYGPYVMRKLTSAFFVSALILLIGFNSPLALGHNFSPDESAKFLALVDKIKGEAQLVQDDLASKNVSLANQHANRALPLVTDNVTKEIIERNPRLSDDLNTALVSLRTSTSNPSMANDINFTMSDLNDVLDEIVTARIEPEDSGNSTIQALRLVEGLDGLLKNYGDAYAVGFDMTNMSMMGSGGEGISSMNVGSSGGGGGNMSSSQQYKLVNISDYQTARTLASKAQELFNSQLMNASSSGATEKVIAAAFQELTSSINEKAPPMDIMVIVHTKIHPNLITAFGLQLDTSTN
jgi:hypothetical protein